MRVPESLQSLVYDGIVDEVVRPLMSGKEAQVYLVLSGGYECVAKIYKDAQQRTFQNRADYTEGRKVRNTRDQRAIDKRTRHGRAQDEAAWRNTEVDMIYLLRAAGVRVPIPHHFIDGVLIMELVCDADGEPAPRLGDVQLQPEEAQRIFEFLLNQVQRMLCAGVVHGDLSDFNVLLGAGGPVVIDFPQSVHASNNRNARKLLLRDVNNLHRFMARFFPDYQPRPLAEEMWHLYERNQLTPDTKLTGRFRQAQQAAVDTRGVLGLIGDASRDERKRREARGLNMRGLDREDPRAQPRDGMQQRGEPSQARHHERSLPRREGQHQARGQNPNFQRDGQHQARGQNPNFQREGRPQQREGQQQRSHERSFQRRDGQPQQRAQGSEFQRDAGRARPAYPQVEARGQVPPQKEPREPREPRRGFTAQAEGNAPQGAGAAEAKRRRRRRRRSGGPKAPTP